MVVLQSPGSDAPPEIPAWGVVLFVLATLGFVLNHWRFRTGWHMDEQFRGRPAAREFTIMLGYIALPGAIGSASMGLLSIVYKLTMPTSSWVVGYTVMLLSAVSVGSGVWMAKECLMPTERRAPDWLKGQRRT